MQGQETFLCEVCCETKNIDQKHILQQCQHIYCQQCIIQLAQSLIDNDLIDMTLYQCPKCQTNLLKDDFIHLLDKKYKTQYFDLEEQYKNLNSQQQQESDESLIEFYHENKLKMNLCMCPCCYAVSEKQKGCSFMRCKSLKCQGKTVFCTKCDQQLDDTDHNKHYENNSPFNGNCRLKRNGQWIDRDLALKMNIN